MTPKRVPYEVRTDRLALRCWSPSEASAMRVALDRSDAHLRPWIPFMAREPRTFDQTVQWLREIRAAFDSDQHYRYAAFKVLRPAQEYFTSPSPR